MYEFPIALTMRHLYPQKLALTSPTSGGRSVGIVRSRGFFLMCEFHAAIEEFVTFSLVFTFYITGIY
jgi:hypothetical protein